MPVKSDFSKLRRYQGQLRTNVANAINNANNSVKEIAQQLAPVSEEGSGGNPPGHLRDNIVITKEATPESLRAETTSKASYGADVEFGTVEHGDAQPHMHPAYESGKSQLISDLKAMGAGRRPPNALVSKIGSE